MEAGVPHVIPSPLGRRNVPSVVAFNDRGERLVGGLADLYCFRTVHP